MAFSTKSLIPAISAFKKLRVLRQRVVNNFIGRQILLRSFYVVSVCMSTTLISQNLFCHNFGQLACTCQKFVQ